MRIAVVGLGKIGLPLAVQYASKGHEVLGVDIRPETVATVNAGQAPFPGEADLQERLSDVVPSRLRATTEFAEAIPHSDAVVVVVPLFVDESGVPDFSLMDAATRDIAANLTPGVLVSYETTLPVGSTRERWKPMLESGSGLQEGSDFQLVFSPERVLTGRVFADLRRYPKLFGALSPQGGRAAREFYEQVLDFDERPDLDAPNGVWDLGTPEAAELAKLAETTYRDVNIALANQFARYAESAGVDIFKVIAASNSQPYSHIHKPGISVGGHCIPVYPQLYLHTDPAASVVRTARAYNQGVPEHAAEMLEKCYGGLTGVRVAVLGAAYRGGVKETAFSGVFPLVDALRRRGAVVSVHDPLFDAAELGSLGLTPYQLGEQTDAAVLHTDHGAYAALGPQDLPGVRAIVDGRHLLDRQAFGDVRFVQLGNGEATGGLA